MSRWPINSAPLPAAAPRQGGTPRNPPGPRRSARLLNTLVLALLGTLLGRPHPARAAELNVVTGRIYHELLAHPAEMDDIRAVGAKMVRIAFEDHRDPAQLALYKNVAAQMKARGVGTLGLLDPNSAPWGNPTTQAYRDAYTESVLWHIKSVPDVKAWEIWNEPENFGFEGDPSRYAPLLIQVYEAVSAARATGEIPADVLLVCAGVVDTRMASIVFDAPEMRQYRAAHNGAVPFDVANYHPYSLGDPWDAAPAKPNGFREGLNFPDWFNKIAAMRGQDGRLLFGNRPFWFTEFGFSTGNFGTARARIALLHMAESIRLIPRIQKAFWYDYHDDVETYGLRFTNAAMDQATGKKPVYYAFMAEATGVGIRRFGAGQTPGVLDPVLDDFTARGGVAVVGRPLGELQPIGSGWVQRFGGSPGGPGLLTRGGADLTVRWVSGDFLSAYDTAGGPGGPLGFPTSERAAHASGPTVQTTQYGFLASWNDAVTARRDGDLDANRALTMGDADQTLAIALGQSSPDPVSALAADANNDARVDARDALAIMAGAPR